MVALFIRKRRRAAKAVQVCRLADGQIKSDDDIEDKVGTSSVQSGVRYFVLLLELYFVPLPNATDTKQTGM